MGGGLECGDRRIVSGFLCEKSLAMLRREGHRLEKDAIDALPSLRAHCASIVVSAR